MLDIDQSKHDHQINYKQFIVLAIVAWTALIIVSFSWNLHLLRSQAETLATHEARANWNKDQAFRRWAARHGGVYVRPDERTPPSPYLSDLPHRDLVTTDGSKLTLMSPAYMMRQLTTEFETIYGIKGHITGQVFINPDNKPDEWELSVLKEFERGVTEVVELNDIDGEPYLRLMKPMEMKEACLQCHAQLGFKVGDIRGGVSISIPLSSYLLAAQSSRYVLMTSHFGIWLLGMVGIGFLSYHSQQKLKQQQKTEIALSKIAQEWNYAMDFFEDAIYLIDLDDKVVRVNKMFYKLTGLTPEQTIGKDIGRILHPQGEAVPCPVCQARKQRRDEIVTMEADHPDNPTGRPIEVMVRIIRDHQDNILGVLMGIHDLTRSRQLSANLRESEQKVSDILNSTAEGIYGLDMDGNCILANPACAVILGYDSEAELIGKNMHLLMHHHHEDGSPYDVEQCQIFQSFKKGIEIHVDDEVFWRADGSCFPVEYWSYPIHRDGEVTGSVVTFFDISERRNTEMLLRRSQKMDALGQLTSGIAHDFNNQLCVVNGYLELMGEGAGAQGKISNWISASKKATQRCIDLTRQLLNFSRQQQTNSVVIDLARQIYEIQEIVQRTVTPAIQVSYDIAKDLWKIKTSKGDLEDVLLNLVINARDAMPDGGEIKIGLNNKVLDSQVIKDNYEMKSGEYVVLSVTDTGHGMANEIQEKIFDPFFTTKEIGKGTGLGMSMVYGFVKRNYGYINITSDVDRGSTFKLYLPAVIEEGRNQKLISEKNDILSSANNETILVVDDETQLRELAVEILSAQGYKVLQAEDGTAAIKLLQSDVVIDLVFCDVVMPGGVNGYQVMEQAKELRPKIKLQLTSGQADRDVDSDQQLRFDSDILYKPYSRKNLVACIQKHFNK